ncbi:hypothetical protein SAMN05421805_104191 [Saccharopolyspora antimicrobica]|uniref:Uncharacterized protein n=1 Tax=Saccharopolyspora antimicrobica TaxID=455193 RepID=A0A1I4YKS1_9PSEU|nr:hypothetical protein [Saccharopolyspora antimicrobica]RKT82720.1 hypothetical protein ATL45_0975 [Saccharopolyspora antimicrobica]SFN38668.1 hypothetical protein SAMN05421805_104191 [Saccharopolyspora antimicrobica]
MRIVYTGPFRAVDVPSLGLTAEQGTPIEVPDEPAARLLEQSTIWAEATPPKPATTKTAKEG